MKLSKIFKTAVLGLVITAGVASVAQAYETVNVPAESMCQVYETESVDLFSKRSNVGRLYDYDLRTVTNIHQAYGTLSTLPVDSLHISGQKKYEEMKQYLSPACKQKLGIR